MTTPSLARAFAALAAFLCLLGLARYRTPSGPPLIPPRGHPPPASEPIDGMGVRALRDGRPMNINQVSSEELQLLPGIGPAIARRIIEYRDAHQRIERVEELLRIPGVGPHSLARFRPLIEVYSDAGLGRSVAQAE